MYTLALCNLMAVSYNIMLTVMNTAKLSSDHIIIIVFFDGMHDEYHLYAIIN